MRLSRFSGKTLAALLALSLLPAPALAAEELSLVQLLALAEERHSGHQVQRHSLKASQEAAPLAFSALLPKVSAAFTERDADEEGSGGGGGSNAWTASLSVRQPLLSVPDWHLWRAAQAQVEAAETDFAAARENLRRDVILAWLQVHLAADTLRLIEARRKTLLAQLQNTKALAAAGQVIEADILSARARLADVESQRAQAVHDLAAARDALARYTRAAAPGMRLTAAPALPPLPSLAVWQRQMEESNLQIKAARQQTAQVRRRLQAAEASVYPRLSLSAARSAQGSLGSASSSWQLQLEQSLYTGGHFSARRRQLIADSDRAHAQLAAVLDSSAHALVRLHGQMRADSARVEALQGAVEAAAALLEVVTVGYNNGVNILTSVLEAEEDLFDAQLSLRRAAYGYLSNLAAARALLVATDDAFAMQIEKLFVPTEEK